MNLMEQIDNMSQEEIDELLNTELPEELEKEASAEIAQAELADALYAYGAYMVDREFESHGDLSKEASAEFDEAHEQITTALEESLNESGILEVDDTAALHKEAQAAAAIIFQGFADQFEKIANEVAASKEPGRMKKFKDFMSAQGSKAWEKTKGAGRHIAAHKGKYGAGAAGVAAAGGGIYAYRRHKNMKKTAGEMSYDELRADIMEDAMIDAVIEDGLSKLANAADVAVAAKKGLGQRAKDIYHAAKGHATKGYEKAHAHVGRNPGRYGLAGGAALGYGAKATHDKYEVKKRKK
jgi:hypothetical protein